MRALLGPMVGVALAVLGQFIIATPQPSSVPQTAAEFCYALRRDLHFIGSGRSRLGRHVGALK